TVFEDYEIPAFLDHARTMLHHPLLELVRSSLDAMRQNWRYDAVFRCVKTDLFMPFDEEDVDTYREKMDRLENYVLAHGIRGHRWREETPWKYQRYQGLDNIDVAQTDEE